MQSNVVIKLRNSSYNNDTRERAINHQYSPKEETKNNDFRAASAHTVESIRTSKIHFNPSLVKSKRGSIVDVMLQRNPTTSNRHDSNYESYKSSSGLSTHAGKAGTPVGSFSSRQKVEIG